MTTKKRKKTSFSAIYGAHFTLCTALIIACAILVSSFSESLTPSILTENISYVNSSAAQNSERVIILDAGHGGRDAGAVGLSGVLEKDLNLDITLMLRDMLVFRGYKVVLTREDDTMRYDESIPLSKKAQDTRYRVDMMKKYENCIFVSIHMNKFVSEKYSGLQVYYSKNTPESLEIARGVQSLARELLQKDNNRQVKGANATIYVLDKASVPAILVECGFLSNAAENERLCDKEYRRDVASTLFLALDSHLQNQNK